MRKIAMLTAVLAVAGLYSSVAPSAERPGDPRAGRALAYAECRGCHGMDGKGTQAGVPDLGGRDAAELLKLLEAYRAGHRQETPIGKIASSGKSQELRDIAAYYSSQPAIRP